MHDMSSIVTDRFGERKKTGIDSHVCTMADCVVQPGKIKDVPALVKVAILSNFMLIKIYSCFSSQNMDHTNEPQTFSVAVLM